MKVFMTLETTPASILAQLEQGKAVGIDGWSLHPEIEQSIFWLTTPYGIDCWFYELSIEGCKKCLDRVESDADMEN